MAQFQIRQCTNPDCLLRIPIDSETHQGAFCPRCGAPMTFEIKVISQDFPDGDVHPASRSFSVILDNIRSLFNVGSIFRTADAIGADQLHLCGFTPTPSEHDAIQKTALGAEEVVPWQYHSNALRLTRRLKEQGFNLITLESTAQAIPLYQFRIDHADQRPVVLVLGNERSGVDPEIIELCDSIIALPMLGEKRSLNVAVAFGAAGYWLTFGQGIHPTH